MSYPIDGTGSLHIGTCEECGQIPPDPDEDYEGDCLICEAAALGINLSSVKADWEGDA